MTDSEEQNDELLVLSEILGSQNFNHTGNEKLQPEISDFPLFSFRRRPQLRGDDGGAGVGPGLRGQY